MRGIVAIFFFAMLAAAGAESAGYAAYEKANALFAAKKFQESAAAVVEALRLDPDLVPALTLKAKLAMAAIHFAEAREALEHALRVDPKAEYAQFLYGLEAYLSNDMGQAMARFARRGN